MSSQLSTLNSQLSRGWGFTRSGRSKKLHYFRDGRAYCSGSAPAPGQSFERELPENADACETCLVKSAAAKNHNNQTGVARFGGRPITGRKKEINLSKLYA